MAKVDELIIEIKGDTSDISKKLDDVVRTTESSTNKMTKSFDNFSAGVGKAAKVLVGFGLAVEGAQAAVGAFSGIVEKVGSARGIQLMADRIGFTTNQMRAYSHVARLNGLDTEILADAIKDLTVKIQDANLGAMAYEDALKAIGLESKNLVGLSPEKQFLAFADAISKADEGLQRFALDEINDAMFQLLPLMKQGSGAILEMVDSASRFAIPESVDQDLIEANTAIQEMNSAWEKMELTLLSKVAPAVTAVANAVTNTLAPAVGNIPTTQGQFSGSAQTGQGFGLGDGGEFNMGGPLESVTYTTPSGDVVTAGSAENAQGQMMTVPEQDLLEAELERAQEFYQRLEEAEAESWERRRILEQEALAESILQEQEAEREKTRIKKEQEEERNRQTQLALRKLGSLMNSENRKMFELGKAARIAEVATTTPKAAMDAYSAMASIPYVGPFLGAAAAAAAIAYGAKQIQQIRSTSFGGGASAGGGGGPQTPDISGAEGAGASSTQTTNFDVTLVGDSFGAEQVRGLIGAINDQTGDNVKLNAVMAG